MPERLSGLPAEAKQKVHVAIIGAGITGIVVGTMLERAGVPYTIFERHPDLGGGTWEANTYPPGPLRHPGVPLPVPVREELPVDRSPATQPDLKEYLKYVANKQGVTPHVQLNSEVEHAAWSQDKQKWELLIEHDGKKSTFEANFLIHGGSFFGTPKKPEIEGMENFHGPIMHTAEWDHDVDLAGKRLGIIGNGSSGVQLVPHLAEIGSSLEIFQRTPAMGHALGELQRPRCRRRPAGCWTTFPSTGTGSAARTSCRRGRTPRQPATTGCGRPAVVR